MANKANTTAAEATVETLVTETVTATPKRRGRPSAFPEGTQIVDLLVKIPNEAREAIRTLKVRREMGLNAIVADLAMKALAASDRAIEQAAARAAKKAAKSNG